MSLGIEGYRREVYIAGLRQEARVYYSRLRFTSANVRPLGKLIEFLSAPIS